MIQKLVKEAVFGREKEKAQEKIKKLAQERGIKLTSIQKLYERGINGFTVPAFNIRTLTFDIARALFRAAQKERVGVFIIELARSEIEYSNQSPNEYIACILAGAIKEGFSGPIFFQGDHFKIDKKKYYSSKREKENKELKNLIERAIRAGFYNIDLDCSSLILEENFKNTAKLTAFIRKLEPKNLTIAIGGEVGEIGGKNTTIEELKEFIKGYNEELKKLGNYEGIIKIAVQTGTSHGGVILPTGKLKQVAVDLKTLKELTIEAKKHHLAGVVQHGASTLDENFFRKFPKTGVCEIHLATVFQNLIYDNPLFPKKLKEKIYSWLKKKFFKERQLYKTEAQFLYKLRKKALGPFKEEIWNIPEENKNKVCQQLEKKFTFFFKSLKVSNTKERGMADEKCITEPSSR